MKIKQLEWEAGRFGTARAKSHFGVYIAGPGGSWPPHDAEPATAANLDEAKAACQADFERRVRECVEEPK